MKTGQYDGKTVVNLMVSICDLGNGGVQSAHDFATSEDADLASKMDSGGARQIAYALFSEALLREVYLDIIIQLKGDPGFMETYKAASEDDRRNIEDILGEKARRIMDRNLARMAPVAAREVLEMLSNQG